MLLSLVPGRLLIAAVASSEERAGLIPLSPSRVQQAC